MKEMERHMKCVFVQWRGSSGVPITSNKTYSLHIWTDIKDTVDYIHKEYCCKGPDRNPQNKASQRPIYIFGVSNGAICATHYLINEGEKSPVRAAAFYGSPIDVVSNEDFFSTSGFGFYNYNLGQSWLKKRGHQFQVINKLSTLEQVASYNKILKRQVALT